MRKKLLFSLLLLIFFFTFIPKTVLAHSPGQLPFVMVDGQYTLFNPTYLNGSSLHSAQDLAPSKYLLGKRVTLFIDLSRRPYPSSFSNQLSFRWSFYQGNNFEKRIGGYFYGNQLTYTFDKAGSYMIVLDVRANQTSFSTIDTILLNVFPTFSYMYPQSSVHIQTNGSSVTLHNVSQLDSSGGQPIYLWDLGKGTLSQGENIETSVDFVNNLPKTGILARVIDAQGLITDVFLRQETFTRQIDYDTVVYVGGTAKTQLGTIVKELQTRTGNETGTVLALSTPVFLENLLFIFLSLIGLIIVRILISVYGQRNRYER